MSKAAQRPRSEARRSLAVRAGRQAQRSGAVPAGGLGPPIPGSCGRPITRTGPKPSEGRAAGRSSAQTPRTALHSRPLVIAHRGASAYRPENTLPAYALAVEQGADMIEIDLHRTRDRALVVLHDARLDGPEGAEEVADATLEAVRALDVGEGEGVPTLEEVLDRFGECIAFNLELKRGLSAAYPELPALALAEVERRGLLERTLFSSFYDPVLAELRAEGPTARIGLLIDPRQPHRPLERARALGAESLHPHVSLASRELVDAAHAEGLAIHVFTVDDAAAMGRLLDLGVDGLFTNVPDRLWQVLNARFP